MAGVNPSTVSRILKTILDGADVGGRVDMDHPSVQKYLSDKGIDSTSPLIKAAKKSDPKTPKKGRPKRSTTSARIKSEELPESAPPPEKKSNGYEKEDVTQYLDMTVNEVVFRHGTDANFLEFLKSVKEIELIEERRLKNAQTKGELVHKNLVKLGIIDPFEEAHVKMLVDGAKKIAMEGKAIIDSGGDAKELEKYISETLSSFIKPAQSKIKRAMKGMA